MVDMRENATNIKIPDSSWKRLRPRFNPLLLASLLVLALLLLALALDSGAGERRDNLDQDAFTRALAASQLLGGFSDHGARISGQLLEQYRAQLDPYFSEYDSSDTPEVDNSGHTLVLTIRDEYLHDPEIGILARSEKKGVHWERPGLAILLKNGEPVFSSRVGVRVHGGYARFAEDKFQISYRLYFRPAYRSAELNASTIWPESDGSLTRLVILKADMDLHTAISFDVARRLDLPAPYLVPMRFIMNGEDQRTKLISQHLGMPFLETRFGRGEYDYFRRKDDDSNPYFKEFHGLIDRIRGEDGSYTLDDVEEHINVDALLNQFLLQIFIELYDSYQGMVVRRRDGVDKRWFFVPWDLEGSLLYNSLQDEFYSYHPEETREYYVHLGSTRYLTRERIWRELWWSTEFRDRFAKVAVDALNHLLTPDWLNGEIDYYQEVGPGVGLRPRHIDEIEEIRGYLLSRPDSILTFLSERWELGPVHEVELVASADQSFLVDGFARQGSFRGRYLDGMEVVLKAEDDRSGSWRVNGKFSTTRGGELRFPVTGDVVVEFVEESSAARASAVAPGESGPQ